MAAQLRDIDPLNCGWSIPATERGVVVSLARPGDTTAVRSYLESLGVLPRETGPGSGRGSEATARRAAERVRELTP